MQNCCRYSSCELSSASPELRLRCIKELLTACSVAALLALAFDLCCQHKLQNEATPVARRSDVLCSVYLNFGFRQFMCFAWKADVKSKKMGLHRTKYGVRKVGARIIAYISLW